MALSHWEEVRPGMGRKLMASPRSAHCSMALGRLWPSALPASLTFVQNLGGGVA